MSDDHCAPGTDSPGRDAVPPGAEVTEAMSLEVYQEEGDRLLRFFIRRVGRADAAELRDQTLTQFFIWWPAHPEHPTPTATLYTIAQRRAADFLRRRGRKLPVEGGDTKGLVAVLAARCDAYAAADLRIDLRQALTGLSDRERRALQLHHLDDMSVAVCAELMGTGVDNMKKILKTALKKLRLSPGLTAYDIPVTVTPQEVRK
ncbi:sigma-70 family RNA polymerase sigma factor [Streptomyces sp. NPDC051976]|uniref:RNA polymerase sigma factor n=1 Tax=Streptomyces sp. NPDC051976 TaxID=3154947 RepID=UPI0034282396